MPDWYRGPAELVSSYEYESRWKLVGCYCKRK